MDANSREALWQEYMESRSPQIREQLIVEYAELVKVVAGRMGMYLGYTVEYDDLEGYGIFGLIDAIDKFELTKGVKFETYASLRIRGSILDQIRKMDWIPRTLRQKQRKLENAMKEMEERLGRIATNEELAESMGISRQELENLVNQTQVANLVSLDDYLEQELYTALSDAEHVRLLVPRPKVKVKLSAGKKILLTMEIGRAHV